jgi:hypothetical protein
LKGKLEAFRVSEKNTIPRIPTSFAKTIMSSYLNFPTDGTQKSTCQCVKFIYYRYRTSYRFQQMQLESYTKASIQIQLIVPSTHHFISHNWYATLILFILFINAAIILPMPSISKLCFDDNR